TESCGPRAMAWSPGGTLLATCVDEGKVLALPGAAQGSVQRVVTVLSDLSGPHGIAFHNGKLYVAETNQLAAYDWDEKNGRAVNPKTNTIWATDNGIDWLGDNEPPEEVNELRDGGDYGWPYCYGDKVPNTKFDRGAAEHCGGTIAPKIKMQAHSAPLGIAF